MLDWFRRLRRRSEVHEPEVAESRAEQKRKFKDWQDTLREVARVEKIAASHHSDLHRPR